MNVALNWLWKNKVKVEGFLQKSGFTDTDEIIQLGSLKLIKNDVRKEASVKAYVLSVIFNEAKNMIRRDKRLHHVDFDIKTDTNPELLYLQKEACLELNKHIEYLPKMQRQVVKIFMENDGRLTEMAKANGMHRESFKTSFRQAKLKLKQTLGPSPDMDNQEILFYEFEEEN